MEKLASLNFNDGLKSLAINGDKNRVIVINPTDTAIINRYSEAAPKLGELIEKYSGVSDGLPIEEAAKINGELDREARKFVDYIIGSAVSDKVFGNANCLSYAGGRTILENFLTAYAEYLEPAVKAEYEKSSKRVAKYTSQLEK